MGKVTYKFFNIIMELQVALCTSSMVSGLPSQKKSHRDP